MPPVSDSDQTAPPDAACAPARQHAPRRFRAPAQERDCANLEPRAVLASSSCTQPSLGRVSVRGVRHLLRGVSGYLSDRLFRIPSVLLSPAPDSGVSPSEELDEARAGKAVAAVTVPPSPQSEDTEESESVTVELELGDARVTLHVRKSDCHRHSEWGSASTARAVGLALRRALGQPDTSSIRSIQYMLKGKSATQESAPADWNSLVSFIAMGGTCRARVRLPTRAG